MKKGMMIWVIAGISVLAIIGIAVFFLLNNSGSNEISCPDYDNDEENCMMYEECQWVPEEGICNSVFMIEDDGGDIKEVSAPIPELEEIEVPDSLSNQLCKKIPLSSHPSYSQRYMCLAIVNLDSRFCEGIEEEKEMKMCMAFAEQDSSYCAELDEKAKHTCYYQLAVSSKNAFFCNYIDYSQNEKEQCYFNFMSNLYQWGKSDEIKAEYCSQLGSPDDKTCLALKAKDVSMCNDNPWCLTFFHQELSFCDEHPEIIPCMNDRAKTDKNISICNLLPQPAKDNCIGGYCTHAELSSDICDMIENVNEREGRYLELAMHLKNWQI